MSKERSEAGMTGTKTVSLVGPGAYCRQGKAREAARDSQPEGASSRVYFFYRDGLLHRHWQPEGSQPGDVRSVEQLVLPRPCCGVVLRLGHDVPMAGHLGIRKTRSRIMHRYYWPGIFKDVATYCRTCEVCQRTQTRRPPRVGMVPMPLVAKPFQRIGMDVVGPLPRTQRGNHFILTICDYATRYPEAIALPSTDAYRVARELVAFFARVGIPEEILTDQGSNFMSALLEEVYHLLQVKRIRSTPYHPQTDGLVERFNGTMKMMLRKFVNRSQTDWDECLPYLLFAYREVPQASTGFSPFELLYGRKVRGPLDILKEEWTGCADEGKVPVAAYVVEMRDRLKEMAELVHHNLDRAQRQQKTAYDKGSKPRSFHVGEEVLVLLPARHNKLKLEWVGPYQVVRKVTAVDYELQTPGNRQGKKTYHVNLLKKWHPAEGGSEAVCLALDPEGAEDWLDPEGAEDWLGPEDEDDLAGELYAEEDMYPVIAEAPEVGIPQLAPDLSEEQLVQLQDLLKDYSLVTQAKPGRTSVIEHEIHVGNAAPVRQRAYWIPYSQREAVKKELDAMLEAGVVRPSTSLWASPIVIVEKKDGGLRFCVDYRRLNQLSKFDAYPMPRIEEVFESVGSSTVITTLDLASGYWQIPMAEGSREKTAFATPFGLFEFTVMPFGLHSTPATFQRMINHVLSGCQDFVRAYIDDIVVYSRSWEEHLDHLRQVLTRLQGAGLTVKIKKCQFGRPKVPYLGHLVGGGDLEPDPGKVQAVKEYPQPETKKDVRAFLGLAGYYRRFIPNFAAVAVPMTELTRKGQPHRVCWTQRQGDAFQKLKDILVQGPVLRVADPSKPYVLQTDASDQGFGAALSQVDQSGEEHPVAFASRKLLPRETRYSTIEKECLAIVWALRFFHVYLYGQSFTIQTDHQPLAWLQRMRNTNSRLTCWAIAVQPYCSQLSIGVGLPTTTPMGSPVEHLPLIQGTTAGLPSWTHSGHPKGGGVWRTYRISPCGDMVLVVNI